MQVSNSVILIIIYAAELVSGYVLLLNWPGTVARHGNPYMHKSAHACQILLGGV